MVYRSDEPRKSAHLSTVVTPEVKAAVQVVAAQRGVPYGVCVREAVTRWLETVQGGSDTETPKETR